MVNRFCEGVITVSRLVGFRRHPKQYLFNKMFAVQLWLFSFAASTFSETVRAHDKEICRLVYVNCCVR